MKRTYDASTDPDLTPEQRRNAVRQKANDEAVAYAEEQKALKKAERADARSERLKAEGRIAEDGSVTERNPAQVKVVKTVSK